MKIKRSNAVIVDDEPKAIRLLQDLLAEIPEIIVAGAFTETSAALSEITKLQPDLLFLDIQMPRMSGFEFLHKVRESGLDPKTIFVTAYDQYAIEAIRERAFDYLLKPVSPEDLKESVQRLLMDEDPGESPDRTDRPAPGIPATKLRFADQNNINFFSADEILFVKAEGNYSMIHLKNREFLFTRKIGEVEEILLPHGFFRVGRSYIINPAYLVRVSRKQHICTIEFENSSHEIPVSEERIRELLKGR